MPYRVTYERKPGYLHVRMEGQESFAEAVRFWHTLSDVSAAEGFTRFLIVDTVVGRLNATRHYRGGLAKVFRSEHDAHQWLMAHMTSQEALPQSRR